MAITYLDSSGRTRKVVVDGWFDGHQRGHWGRYGAWTMFNLNPLDLVEHVTDESLYAGDGYHFSWHIRWS
jgi:hypothetical protein